MRKAKLLVLCLSLALLLPVLAGCAGGAYKAAKPIKSYDEIYAAVDVPEDRSIQSSLKISDLEDYTFVSASEWVAVFSYVKPLTAAELASPTQPSVESRTTYAVYSFATGRVYNNFASTKDYTYSISVSNVAPIFTVTRAETKANGDTTYTVYDAANNQIWTDDKTPGSMTKFADLYKFEGALYSEADGVMTKTYDIPENLALYGVDAWNENYYYSIDEDTGVIVYDKTLKPVMTWTKPYSMGAGLIGEMFDDDDIGSIFSGAGFNAHVLNDGNVLIQYTTMLESKASKYDLALSTKEGGTFKYDMTTILLNVADNKTKELNVDCMVLDLETRRELTEDGNEALYTADGFENIATIVPIVDKQVMSSVDSMDIVLIENSGKLGKSLKLAADQQAYMPSKVADGIYLVYTLYGGALVNAEGEILNTFNNYSMEFCGKYLVGDRAIYDLSFNKVYDLDEKNATVYKTCGEVLLLQVKTRDGYDIVKFDQNGTETKLASCTNGEAGNSFGMLEGTDSCYYIYNKSKETYTCYNLNQTVLIEATKNKPVVVSAAENGSFIVKTVVTIEATLTTPETSKNVFYIFKSAEMK